MTKALRVGIFVVATLFIFGVGVFWIGSREFRFKSTYRLNADFQTVAGLDEGASVRVGGIREGTVRRIVLPQRPDQKIRVEMDLNSSTRDVVKKDSLAAIRTEGLVGDQYVEITFGSLAAQKVNNGDAIGSEPPLEISDMIKKTNNILDSAQGAMQGLDQTVNNLQSISSSVNQGKGTVGALINNRDVYHHVDEATRNLQDDTEALKHNFLLRGFFKKRGYEDDTMLTQNAIRQMPAGAPEKKFMYPSAKMFEKPDTAKIKNAKMIDEAGRFLQNNGYRLAVVAAYADMKGDSDEQLKFTEARAAVVREYLVQHFKLDDTKLKTIGLGKSNTAPDGGEVDILLYSEGPPTDQPGGQNEVRQKGK
jgi:phospholipid/cholesterol/gamma-HCH transport system substrate-binding protein